MPRSGIEIAEPEFEWRDVARANGYRYPDWELLDVSEQESQIAHHRMSGHIQAVLTKDAIDRQKQAARKAKK